MEAAFGVDFTAVRVHHGATAAALGAEAFAYGIDIHFAPGRYDPTTPAGLDLIGHELAHVIQQARGRVRATAQVCGVGVNTDPALESEADAMGARTSRAPRRGPRVLHTLLAPAAPVAQGRFFNIGTAQVPIYVSAPDQYDQRASVDSIVRRITATGAAVSPEQRQTMSGWNQLTLHWLQHAMHLVEMNCSYRGPELAAAYAALWNAASHEQLAQPGDPGDLFERQVLAIVGWFRRATASSAAAPDARTLRALAGTYNPPPPRQEGSPPDGELRLDEFRQRMTRALGQYLIEQHTASVRANRNNDIDTVRTLADHVQELAEVHFAPFIGKTIASRDLFGFRYAQNVIDLETVELPDQLLADYLTNRCEKVGGTIWHETHFNAADPRHAAVLRELVGAVITGHRHEVIEVVRATPIHSDGRVYISRRVAPDANLYALRWSNLYTLCHEYLHTLQHPDFVARAGAIARGQIIKEGFVEAFAYELKLLLHGAARRNPAFKALLEAGVPREQVTDPPPPPLEYEDAAVPAFNIIRTLGPIAARKAFFLGAVELAGLAPDQLPTGADAMEDGRPVTVPLHHQAFPGAPDAQEQRLDEEAPRGPGFLPEGPYVSRNVDQVARVQVFRHELRERCRNLLAYKRDHGSRDVPRPDHDDHGAAVVARAEAVAFRDALPRLRRGLADMPDIALKDEMTRLIDDLDRWTMVFVLSFPAPRGQ
jgi:hypothetical protein